MDSLFLCPEIFILQISQTAPAFWNAEAVPERLFVNLIKRTAKEWTRYNRDAKKYVVKLHLEDCGMLFLLPLDIVPNNRTL